MRRKNRQKLVTGWVYKAKRERSKGWSWGFTTIWLEKEPLNENNCSKEKSLCRKSSKGSEIISRWIEFRWNKQEKNIQWGFEDEKRLEKY